MKEIPILMSTPMVQAIPSGIKTETRRTRNLKEINQDPDRYEFLGQETTKKGLCVIFRDKITGCVFPIKSPYGTIGDQLWVKETWNDRGFGNWIYKADDPEVSGPWTPSIYMPKYACRIRLLVKDVRVERLQDISEEDAIAEGVGSGFQMNGGWPDYEHIENGVCTVTQDTARMSYWSLWDSINGKGSWGKNPWVWVIKFKKI